MEVSHVMRRSRFGKHANNNPEKPAELRHSFILHRGASRRFCRFGSGRRTAPTPPAPRRRTSKRATAPAARRVVASLNVYTLRHSTGRWDENQKRPEARRVVPAEKATWPQMRLPVPGAHQMPREFSFIVIEYRRLLLTLVMFCGIFMLT